MDIEKKRGLPIKEALTITGALALLYYISLFAFNKNQVEAIKKRDKGRCQFPGCSNKTKYNVEVHHVIPQGYSFRVNNMRPDSPFNAVCLCEEHHVGYPKDGRKQAVGMVWDPIHPDTYFVHLILAGKFDLLPERIKAKINQDFPGLYEYYKNVSIGAKGAKLDYKHMYDEVMRKWRSDRLENREVYWNSDHDAHLQIAAINATITAIKRRWRFPLKMLGGNVKAENRGMYAWDNLVALAIEKYVRKLPRHELLSIFREMKAPGAESRIIYYYRIYTPALAHFENRADMAGVLNSYLASLPEKEACDLIKRFDKVRDSDEAYGVLFNGFYEPAINSYKSKQNGSIARTQRTQMSNAGTGGLMRRV